ncbi:MAG TPA: PKD domain-containing protein, partial [Chitinophagales bacterium]|nr:PKD domain-containing protein [Chitinophagales bacterium]
GKMYTGVGYVSQGAGTVTFSGFPNDGTVKVIITKNAATGVAWNLVGNPYPSAVNALEFVRQNAALITGSLYFWDDDGSGGSGWTSQDYAVWNAAGTVAGPNTELQFDGHIASGQSFFVEKIDEGTSILNFSNTMRSTKNNAFFRTAPIERLWMSVVGPANDYNETLIAFMDEATHGYDRMYDAKKLYGNAGIALYTKDMKHRYAIQSLAPLTDDKSIVMGLDAGAAGNYTLEVKKIDALDESVTIILEDTETGHTQNLRADDTYTFYADAGTHDSRFILRFSPALQIGVSDATCFGDDGTITVRQAGIQPWSLSLIDENDFIIDRVAGFNGTKIFSGLTPGQYLLVLRDEYGYRLEKNIEVKGATPVKADFEASTSSVKEGEEISFSNLSEGAASYEWDFGDGSPLLLAEQASHIYTAHGIYEVKLTAHNSDCSALKTVLVAVSGKVTDIAPVENNGFYAYTDGQSLNVVFRFDKAEPAQLSIYDVAGKQLASENVLTAGTKNLPIEHGSSYLLLQLITEKNAYAQKILVMSR